MSDMPLLDNAKTGALSDIEGELHYPDPEEGAEVEEISDPPLNKQYERRQTKRIANAAAYISLVLDLIIFIIAIADVSLYQELPNFSVEDKYEEGQMKVEQMFLLLLFNHIFGTFPFFYVYLTVSIFPSARQLEDATLVINVLNALESVLAFISLHLRYSARFLAMPDQSSALQMISGDIPYAIRQKSYKSRLFSTILIIVCDIISVLAQASIFYFACDFLQDGTLALHYVAIYAGTPGFFLINFLIIHLIAKIFYKDIFEANKRRRSRYRKMFFLQLIAILLIGVLLGAFINFTFWAYAASRRFVSNLDPEVIKQSNYFFPTFSNKQANILVTIACSFILLYTSLFSIFVNQKHSEFVFVLNENKSSMQILKIIWRTFIIKNFKNIISNSIVASVLLTTTIADFVSLLFIVASGGISGEGTIRIIMEVVSFIGIVAIVVLYSFLIYKEMRKTSKMFAFLTFLTGFIAIPGIFSVSLVESALTKMMPCAVEEGFEMFLAQGIIPLSGAISFISSAPYMFPKSCKEVRKQAEAQTLEEINSEVADGLAEVREFIRKEDREIVLPDEQPHEAVKFTEPNMHEFYKASKIATGAFFYEHIKEENQIVADKKGEQVLKKEAVFAEVQGDSIYIGIRGTRSILNITPVEIISGIFDWIKASMMPTVIYEYDDNQFCLANVAFLRQAQKICDVLSKTLNERERIVITGHHQGAVVAIILAQKLLRLNRNLNITVYMFGAPMLVQKQLVQFVNSIGAVKMCVIGADGKLFLSSILSNELKWPDDLCFCLDHAASSKEIVGYYAIMSTGSDPEAYIPALKKIL